MSPSVPIYTRPLDEKLGIKPGMRVETIDISDPRLTAIIADGGGQIVSGSAREPVDLIFLGADWPPDLDRLPELRRRIRPNGAIWVVSRKGKGSTLRDTEVIEAGLASGLVDNKVVSFSDTHTAQRLVIRLADRPAHAAELERATSS